jgi:uncharacterized lipoprotein YddW (UPF0748 family)
MAGLKKGVWLHNLQQFKSPREVRDFARKYADEGFDLLIPCVKNPDGLLDYHGEAGNVRPVFRDWDPLEHLADEAVRQKIRVHAWFCNAMEGPESRLMQRHPGVTAVNREGKRPPARKNHFVCMARPEVREYEAALMKEVVDKYPVAGVHFDYIRVGDGTCWCAYCRKHLKRLEGITPEKVKWWSRVPERFFKWRCDNITALVREVSSYAHKKGREASAAVYSGIPEAILSQGQDAPAWKDMLDMIAPMNYWNSPWLAERWMVNHIAQFKGGKAEMRQGFGRYCMDSIKQFKEQLDMVRKHKIAGVVIFEHNSLKKAEFKLLGRY